MIRIINTHYAATIGVPLSAISAFCVVILLHVMRRQRGCILAKQSVLLWHDLAPMLAHQIETARCHLHPLTVSEADALHALWTHPRVRRYLWDDVVIPKAETVRLLRQSTRLFDTDGFGLWGVRFHDDATLIGFAGYWYFRDPPERELLIGIAPAHWGRGLATEIGAALIRFAFEALGFRAVHASTDTPHAASVRVMEKLGMAFDRRAVLDGLDTVFYTLSRRQWRAAHPH